MKKYTLEEKIKKIYIRVFVLILFITVVAMYLITEKIYRDKSWQLCEQLVSLNLDILNNQMMEVLNWQEMLAKSEVVEEAAYYYNNHPNRDYTKELYYQRALDDAFYLLARNRKIGGAYIITTNGQYRFFYKESPKIGYNMLEQDWYSGLVKEINQDTCYVS